MLDTEKIPWFLFHIYIFQQKPSRQLFFRLCHNNDIRTTTISIAKSSDTAVMIHFVTTVSKVSVFGDILVSIFPHSDWIRTRITPNTDNFYAVFLTLNINAEAHSVPCQISTMDLFTQIVHDFQPSIIFAKSFILGVWQSYEYTWKIFFNTWQCSLKKFLLFSVARQNDVKEARVLRASWLKNQTNCCTTNEVFQ